ncbi:hypothetical protein CMU96_07690 [Elizabethkingia anophelis]|nr:hypothetical protein [Elizabethkingia anophelis]
MNNKSHDELLKKFFALLEDLREVNILKNKKDFTGQIGEWLVEMIYDGERSQSGIEKGWDVKVNNEFIQVKTHAKSSTNSNRWSALKCDYENIKIDYLIIIVFEQDYKLREFFKIPWSEALKYVKIRGKTSPRSEINWNSVEEYKIDIHKLPHQEIVQLFV